MDNLVAKIVLTGGPCAGKTTTISRIEDYLTSKGYHVLVLNECATETIKSGIRPFGNGAVNVFDFQNEIINLQLYKEDRFNKILDKLPLGTKVVMLLDRGILDNKAYLGDDMFNELMIANDLTEEDILNRYDLVIHMITVASDMENRYSNSNNTARFEDSKEAIELDKRTSEAWKNHNNLKIVGVCETLEEKINKVLGIVDELIEK